MYKLLNQYHNKFNESINKFPQHHFTVMTARQTITQA